MRSILLYNTLIDKAVFRPALLFGADTWAAKKADEVHDRAVCRRLSSSSTTHTETCSKVQRTREDYSIQNVERGTAVIEGMVILHKMQSTALGTVVCLNHRFNDLMLSTTRGYDDIILVFDTYKDVSLKYATREARLQGQHTVHYQIHDETSIKHITMKRFLSHDKTNADLADYLAMKVLTYNTDSPKLVITLSSGYTRSNGSIEFEDNNHEEADTLMIDHAVLSSRRNSANARIVIFSPDTDVLVLAVAKHHHLLRNASVSMLRLYGIRSLRCRAYRSCSWATKDKRTTCTTCIFMS